MERWDLGLGVGLDGLIVRVPRAKFPLGRDQESRWVEVPVMSTSFDPAEGFDPLAVAANASVLGHVPHWLRTASTEDVLGTPLTRSGAPLPVMPPARPDLLAARTRAGAKPKRGMVAKLPPRLTVP